MLLYFHDDEVTGMEKNKEIKKFGDKENVIYETPELKRLIHIIMAIL